MEQQIKDRINATSTMKEAEQVAEKLTYELSYEHKTAEWRTIYSYLRQEDFRELGWLVLCVGTKQKQFKDWLKLNGFLPHEDKIFYKSETKEMFMVGEYANGEIVGIDNFRSQEPTNLLSVQEYKDLMIKKLIVLNEKRKGVQSFVDSLVQEHKEFLEQEENEMLKQQIIDKALEQAREQKLII